jgi:predicted RNA binding protein YcfA (HicA-like mRNA interferase family)
LKLPRDLSGKDFAQLLRRFGYEVVRQEGSHLRLTSVLKGNPHHITIPNHDELKVGTLRKVIRLVADYLQLESAELIQKIFGQ